MTPNVQVGRALRMARRAGAEKHASSQRSGAAKRIFPPYNPTGGRLGTGFSAGCDMRNGVVLINQLDRESARRNSFEVDENLAHCRAFLLR